MGNKIDYYQLAREFIKTIRGQLSQRELSHKLGYSFNKVGKWESGVTQIKWSDFLNIAEAFEYPVEKNLARFFGNYRGSYQGREILEYLEVFLALPSINDNSIQKLLKKWQLHKVTPDLAEFFMILDKRPAMLFGFLAQYVDCNNIDILKEEFAVFIKELEILADDPNVGYVNEALKVKEYKELENHDEKILAVHAGCTVAALRKTLKNQLNLGHIYFDGKKYHPSAFDFSFSTLNNPQIRKFNKYTFDLVAKKYPLAHETFRLDHIYNSSRSSNRVVAISRQASLKLDKLVSKFHNDVGEIIKNDNHEKDNVQIISLASVAAAIKVIQKK